MPRTEKDDGLDWQAYFHQGYVNHLVNMQYSAAKLREVALEDLLTGPEHLFPTLKTRANQGRKFTAQMPDGRLFSGPAEFPKDANGQEVKTFWARRPKKVRAAVHFAKGLLHQLKNVPADALEAPQLRIPNAQAKWWRLQQANSALVGNAAGSGVWWYRRDAAATRGGILRSAKLHAKVLSRWDELAQQYRDALAAETSPEAWEQVWGISASRD